MERAPTLLLGAAENPFGKVWYTPLQTKKKKKKKGEGGGGEKFVKLYYASVPVEVVKEWVWDYLSVFTEIYRREVATLFPFPI